MSLEVEIKRRFGRYDVHLRYGGTMLMWTIADTKQGADVAAKQLLLTLQEQAALLQKSFERE